MSNAFAMPLEPPVQSFTTWINPTNKVVKIDIYVGPSAYMMCINDAGKRVPRNPSGRVRYVIPAGGQLDIPSEHDGAIHDVRDGQIVGGLGTVLVRKGSSDQLSEALDANLSAKKAADMQAALAADAKRAQEQAIAVAVAQGMAAEKARIDAEIVAKLAVEKAAATPSKKS